MIRRNRTAIKLSHTDMMGLLREYKGWMSGITEDFARSLLQQAIREGRAAELLTTLFEGGSATLDAMSGRLVLASPSILEQLMGSGDDDSS